MPGYISDKLVRSEIETRKTCLEQLLQAFLSEPGMALYSAGSRMALAGRGALIHVPASFDKSRLMLLFVLWGHVEK